MTLRSARLADRLANRQPTRLRIPQFQGYGVHFIPGEWEDLRELVLDPSGAQAAAGFTGNYDPFENLPPEADAVLLDFWIDITTTDPNFEIILTGFRGNGGTARNQAFRYMRDTINQDYCDSFQVWVKRDALTMGSTPQLYTKANDVTPTNWDIYIARVAFNIPQLPHYSGALRSS